MEKKINDQEDHKAKFEKTILGIALTSTLIMGVLTYQVYNESNKENSASHGLKLEQYNSNMKSLDLIEEKIYDLIKYQNSLDNRIMSLQEKENFDFLKNLYYEKLSDTDFINYNLYLTKQQKDSLLAKIKSNKLLLKQIKI